MPGVSESRARARPRRASGSPPVSPAAAGSVPRAVLRANAASARADSRAALRPSSRRCRDFPRSVERASMRPEGSGVRTPAPSGRCFPGARLRYQPVTLPHASAALAASPRRPFVRSDLGPTSVTWRPRGSRAFALPTVRPFAVRTATMASADFSLRWPCGHRRPFRRKARSPRVRTSAFAARPPDLRRLALVTRASRLLARSPCSAPPSIRFLFVGPQLRSPLPSRQPHGPTLCGSLRSL
jgi:hypothetical protein